MDTPLRILMLEDNTEDAEIIVSQLKRANFHFTSKLVMNRDNFLTELERFAPDLVLSDNSMPQFSATDALEIIQQRSIRIPFILVTGTVSEEFAANIIRLGADDYILKDRPGRLPAAIHSALQKKWAESIIHSKEEQIKFKANLLAAVGQAVIATNLEGNVIYWNKAAEEIYGWTSSEAYGKQITELTPSIQHKDQAIAIFEHLKKGNSWMGEFMVQRKDGITFPAFVTNSPIFDQHGQLAGIVGVSNDISEQRRANDELRALEKKILESQIQHQKMITRAIIKAQEEERNFIGQELHDNISQILAGTRLYLSAAAQRSAELSEVLKYPLSLIENSIEEIRLLSSKHVTPVKNINLERLIENLVNNLHKSTEIKVLFVYTVTSVDLKDEFKLNIYRIIQELINNIMKHARANNVTILVDQVEQLIMLDVMDDGRGFDVLQERSGIGISNIVNRVESFNGTIDIKSGLDAGSRIRIRLPI